VNSAYFRRLNFSSMHHPSADAKFLPRLVPQGGRLASMSRAATSKLCSARTCRQSS